MFRKVTIALLATAALAMLAPDVVSARGGGGGGGMHGGGGFGGRFEMTGEWHPCSSDEFSDLPKPGMKPTPNGHHYHKIGVMARKAHGRSAMRMCVTVKKTKGF